MVLLLLLLVALGLVEDVIEAEGKSALKKDDDFKAAIAKLDGGEVAHYLSLESIYDAISSSLRRRETFEKAERVLNGVRLGQAAPFELDHRIGRKNATAGETSATPPMFQFRIIAGGTRRLIGKHHFRHLRCDHFNGNPNAVEKFPPAWRCRSQQQHIHLPGENHP